MCVCYGSKRETVAVYEGQWDWSNDSNHSLHTDVWLGTCLLPKFPETSNKQCLPWSRLDTLLHSDKVFSNNEYVTATLCGRGNKPNTRKGIGSSKIVVFSLEHNGSQLGDMRCFQPISHKTRVRFLGPNPSVTAIGDWSSRSVVHLCSRSFWQYPDIRSSIRRRVSKCQQ